MGSAHSRPHLPRRALRPSAQLTLYAASLGLHALIALGVGSIEERDTRPPIRVVVHTPPPRREAPPPEAAPEPVPAPEPTPVAVPTPPVPEAPPTPRPARPTAPAPAEAPAPAPAPVVPSFGIALSGTGTGPGIAVPEGTPGGSSTGTGDGRRVREERRSLEAAAPPVAEEDASGCPEAETRPRALARPTPHYTEEARAARIEGLVRVEITVDAEGHVTDARVITSLDPGLDEAALVAAREIPFAPATRCGAAVEATVRAAITFQL